MGGNIDKNLNYKTKNEELNFQINDYLRKEKEKKKKVEKEEKKVKKLINKNIGEAIKKSDFKKKFCKNKKQYILSLMDLINYQSTNKILENNSNYSLFNIIFINNNEKPLQIEKELFGKNNNLRNQGLNIIKMGKTNKKERSNSKGKIDVDLIKSKSNDKKQKNSNKKNNKETLSNDKENKNNNIKKNDKFFEKKKKIKNKKKKKKKKMMWI